MRKLLWSAKYRLGQFSLWLDIYRPKTRAFFRWFERIYWAQHNARVITDFEYRMSVMVDVATSGRMSKPYYNIEAMKSEIEEAFQRERNMAYGEALIDQGVAEPVDRVDGPPRPSSPPTHRMMG